VSAAAGRVADARPLSCKVGNRLPQAASALGSRRCYCPEQQQPLLLLLGDCASEGGESQRGERERHRERESSRERVVAREEIFFFCCCALCCVVSCRVDFVLCLCLNIVYCFFCSSLALQSLSRVAGHKRSRRQGTNVENPSTRDRRALSASPRACWKLKELESEREREREREAQ